MTKLAVSICAKDEQDFAGQLKIAHGQGAEAIEIRVDALEQAEADIVLGLIGDVKAISLPVIVTCRDVVEGGIRDIEFSHRLQIYRKAIEAEADYIDIEYRTFKHPDVHSVIKAALELSNTSLILSAHNFEGPFEDIDIVYESILSLYPEAIPKIVFKAQHINDCFECFDLLINADGPLITFCMGQAGQISRVLSKKIGGLFSYAAIDEAHATAPGQMSAEAMIKLFRWDALNSETEVFGVIGNPVGHSLSPLLHNACFQKEKINALYLPILLEGDYAEFAGFLDQVRMYNKLGFGGFSVTIPHKTNALRYAREHGDYIDPLAISIGSVNTLKIGFNGIVSGYNTDYAGAMDALKDVTGQQKHKLHQKSVAVIGAGGVARAVVAGLIDSGANVTIYNRTVSRAKLLAEELGCRAEGLDALNSSDAEIIINCTSIGMQPNTDACPVPDEVLRRDMVVFDTVYNPLETVLLQKAKAAGALTINGAEMFIRQAAAQYRIFIGQEPDEELMRKIVLNRLKSN